MHPLDLSLIHIYAHFARIGEGSLGGKGRGLAFLDNIIKRHPEFNQYIRSSSSMMIQFGSVSEATMPRTWA